MSRQYQFFQLPVVPDQGLPQRFTFTLGAGRYEATLYANLEVPDNDSLTTLYDLSSAGAAPQPSSPPGFIVLQIDRRSDTGLTTIFLRKVVPEPGLVHLAAELAVKVTQAVIARGNLGGQGRYGSQLTMGVAQRWA